MGRLTALAVKNAKEPGRYQDGGGLMLVVRQSGARSWLLRMQADGKRRDFGLGKLADVGLAEARERAAELRKLVNSGVDPVAAKRAEKLARTEIPTFEQAARTAYEEYKGGWKNEKHKAQWITSMEAYAFPLIGNLKVNEIDGPMIRSVLLPIWLDKPETARRVKQRIGTVLDWAHANGFRDSEAPVRSIAKGLPKQPRRDNHFAAMPYASLPAFYRMASTRNSVGWLAMRFLILTAARSGEVRGATWEEIDFDDAVWIVSAQRMKAGREHLVPLCEEAVEILRTVAPLGKGRKSAPLFPGLRGKPMSDMTLTQLLRKAGIKEATVHGFRSSFRDWAAEQTATPGDVVEAALAHTVANRVEAAYRRTNYLEKRRDLMASWEQFLVDVAR